MIGMVAYYLPGSLVYHVGSASFSDLRAKLGYLERGRLMVVLKNYQTNMLIRLLPILLVTEAATIVHAVLWGWLSYKIRAHSDVIRSLRLLSNSRRGLKRKLSDTQVMQLFTATIDHALLGNLVAPLDRIVGLLDALLLNQHLASRVEGSS